MKNVLILRHGEIHLKGKNKGAFERQLMKNIKIMLKPIKFKLEKLRSRYYIHEFELQDKEEIMERLTKVFGLVSFSEAVMLETNETEILNFCRSIELNCKTFRAVCKRADKSFPHTSEDFARIAGGEIWENNQNVKVQMKNADVEVLIDIRDDGHTFISTKKIACVGGLPLGSAGKGLVLLSGGIDSPVAAFQMAKRGLAFDAFHFHSFPHTSQMAKEKVISLAKQMRDFSPVFVLWNCSLTEIQEEIYRKCSSEFQITIMRRFMLRICERWAKEKNLSALITGESLSQVASQTVESLTTISKVLDSIQVLRPLISFDKEEIMKIAQKIGTFEISIQPFEDCCTVFLPKNPAIRPKLEKVEKEETKLNIDLLVQNAIDSIEMIIV